MFGDDFTKDVTLPLVLMMKSRRYLQYQKKETMAKEGLQIKKILNNEILITTEVPIPLEHIWKGELKSDEVIELDQITAFQNRKRTTETLWGLDNAVTTILCSVLNKWLTKKLLTSKYQVLAKLLKWIMPLALHKWTLNQKLCNTLNSNPLKNPCT